MAGYWSNDAYEAILKAGEAIEENLNNSNIRVSSEEEKVTADIVREVSDNNTSDLDFRVVEGRITAFNTIPEQTDDKPCESASGDWICGRNDVIACPPQIPFYSWVEIKGNFYECLDRIDDQEPDHFDISFDKDIEEAKNWGVKYLPVKILNPN